MWPDSIAIQHEPVAEPSPKPHNHTTPHTPRVHSQGNQSTAGSADRTRCGNPPGPNKAKANSDGNTLAMSFVNPAGTVRASEHFVSEWLAAACLMSLPRPL